MTFWNLANLLPTAKKRPSDSSTPNPKRRRTSVSTSTSTTSTAKTTSTLPSSNRNRNTTTTTPNTPTTPTPLLTPKPKTPPSTRYNPAINPSHPQFTTIHTAFNRLLHNPSSTIDSILSTYFTTHEQELLRPCPTPPQRRQRQRQRAGGRGGSRRGGGGVGGALAAIQEKNRWRYAELLRTERFVGWKGRADLGFKLALVWFGLPVAPMAAVGGVDVGGDEDGSESDGDGEGEDGGVLRFLNGYTERVYGKDVGVREPDPKMEAYYVKERRHGQAKSSGFVSSVGLRGGEAFEEGSESSSSREDTSDDTSVSDSSELELRGGATRTIRRGKAAQTPSHPGKPDEKSRFHSLVTTLGGPSSGPEESWCPLYGYQGMVWFRTDQIFTFVDAVDRLLCLDTRAGVTYSLYLMDKRKKYATQVERDEFLGDLTGNGITIWAAGAGDYSNDQVAFQWLRDRIGVTEEEQIASQKVLFVAGPADPIPWKWEPDDSHRVQEVRLLWPHAPKMNRPDVAYLRMPENPADVVYANQYGPWMTNVCRVLAAGRIPGRPGYPAIPDAWFTLRYPPGNGIGTYGGLAFPPQLWNSMVELWEDVQAAPVNLEAMMGLESKNGTTNRWHLFLPGTGSPYEKQFILHSEVGDVKLVRQRIMELVRRTMSTASFSLVQSVEVYLPGAGFFLASTEGPEVTVPVTDKEDLDSAFQPVVELMVEWVKYLTEKGGVDPVPNGLGLFPQFLSLRPVFKDYFLGDAEGAIDPLPWDLKTTTVDQFRRLAGQVFSTLDGQEQLYSPDKSWIAITQGFTSVSGDPDESKLKLLVGPKTTEDEWQSMRKLIVDFSLSISLLDPNRLPRFGDLKTKQPFGFNDIYKTTDVLLYRTIKQDQLPVPRRHYDWQMDDEDVTKELETVQPWEEQPEPLSTFWGLEHFPLRPPPGTKLPTTVVSPRNFEKDDPPAPRNAPRRATQASMDSLGFRPVTNVEKGQRLRERSYAHPLDVRMHMSVPINAPPVGKLLDLRQDSVPVVSLSVLTPTEVRRLQRDYHNMRNLALSRIERCPYPDCDAVYPANDSKGMERHLQDKHVAEKCNFCDDQLFAYWPPEWRHYHMMQKHLDVLASYVQPPADNTVQMADEGRTDRTRERSWIYCPRCGRHHAMLNVAADRQHHDNVCYPGAGDQEAEWVACGTCGDRITDTGLHGHDEESEAENSFCEHCGLPLSLFSELYASKHLAFCKGHGRDDAQYCPWCGIQLDDDFEARMEHIDGCNKLPFHQAEGPIDVARRAYYSPSHSRVVLKSGRAGGRATKRRSNENAGEGIIQAQKRSTKKMKIDVPPPGPITHRDGRSTEGSSPLSSAPSTSHSKRAAGAWLPRAPPPPSSPTAAVPAKATGKAGTKAKATPKASAKTPTKAKTAAKAKATPTKKASATPKTAKAKTKATPANPTPKPAATPRVPKTPSTPVPLKRTRKQTREAAAATAEAEDQQQQQEEEDEQQQQSQTPAKTASAKAARTVSYAEPLERGASPVRGAGARRLGPAIHLAGVGTRWGY